MTDANDLIQQRAAADALAAKARGGAQPVSRSRVQPNPHTPPAPAGEGVTDTAELLRLINMIRQAEATTQVAEKLIVIGEFSVPAARVPETYVDCMSSLSRMEAAVLRMLGWGRSNQDIAMLLDSTENTVRTHMNNTIKKLNLDGMRELITLAGLLFHPLD